MHKRARAGWVHAAAVLAGFLVGAVGSFLQAARASVGSVQLPYGVVAALGLCLLVFVGAGVAARGRSGALAGLLGWLVVVVLLALPRREGDLVLASATYTYVWLYGGVLLGGLSLFLPYRVLAGLRPPVPRPGTRPEAGPDAASEAGSGAVGGG